MTMEIIPHVAFPCPPAPNASIKTQLQMSRLTNFPDQNILYSSTQATISGSGGLRRILQGGIHIYFIHCIYLTFLHSAISGLYFSQILQLIYFKTITYMLSITYIKSSLFLGALQGLRWLVPLIIKMVEKLPMRSRI